MEDQRTKLEESQGLLVSNQQMIQWLNGQVNDAQLGRLGTSSRYSFRPSAPLPTPTPTSGGSTGVGAGAGLSTGGGVGGAGGYEGLGGSTRHSSFRGEPTVVSGARDSQGVTYKPRAAVPAVI